MGLKTYEVPTSSSAPQLVADSCYLYHKIKTTLAVILFTLFVSLKLQNSQHLSISFLRWKT